MDQQLLHSVYYCENQTFVNVSFTPGIHWIWGPSYTSITDWRLIHWTERVKIVLQVHLLWTSLSTDISREVLVIVYILYYSLCLFTTGGPETNFIVLIHVGEEGQHPDPELSVSWWWQRLFSYWIATLTTSSKRKGVTTTVWIINVFYFNVWTTVWTKKSNSLSTMFHEVKFTKNLCISPSTLHIMKTFRESAFCTEVSRKPTVNVCDLWPLRCHCIKNQQHSVKIPVCSFVCQTVSSDFHTFCSSKMFWLCCFGHSGLLDLLKYWANFYSLG